MPIINKAMSHRYLQPSQDTDAIFREDKFARAYQLYMLAVVSVWGYSWIYVSASNILVKGEASGVSLPATTIYLAVSMSWLLYGALKKDPVILVGSTIAIFGSLFLMVAIFYVSTF